MIENNIKNTISDLINEIKTTTENNLSNLEQIMEALIVSFLISIAWDNLLLPSITKYFINSSITKSVIIIGLLLNSHSLLIFFLEKS